MHSQSVQFNKCSFIKQQIDSFAGGELAARMLAFCRLRISVRRQFSSSAQFCNFVGGGLTHRNCSPNLYECQLLRIPAATRKPNARIVSTGLKPPLVTCSEPSA